MKHTPHASAMAAENKEAAAPAVDLPEMLSSLPTELGFPPYLLRSYGGFWVSDLFLLGVAASHSRFRTDVLLPSLPKSGTTWLKALGYAVMNRAAHPPPAGAHHPLHHGSPHDLVGIHELAIDNRGSEDDGDLYEVLPSPRLLSTHLPYSLLPQAITQGAAGGRIVYVCRDPKDTLVSLWHFHLKTTALLQAVPGVGGTSSAMPMPTFEEAFELYCKGQSALGPHWRHALEYWEASLRSPDQVLFLKYEDMLRDPPGHLRTMAAFMGCPFSPEEEAAGVLGDIVNLCSLESLEALEVNRSGSSRIGIKNDSFFRNGVAGDWSSIMTPEMAARLDGVVADALKGSTLTFGASASNKEE